MKTRGVLAIGAAGAIGLGASAAPDAAAVTPGYSLPIDEAAFNSNTAPLANCHHSSLPAPGGTCGQIYHHWYAIDLSQGSGASIFAVTGGRFVRAQNGNVRISYQSTPGGGINWQYLHGTLPSNPPVPGQFATAGQLIMKMGKEDTGTVHLHNEVRYLDGDNGWETGHYYYGFCTRRILKRLRSNLSLDYSVQFAAWAFDEEGPGDTLLATYDAACMGEY